MDEDDEDEDEEVDAFLCTGAGGSCFKIGFGTMTGARFTDESDEDEEDDDDDDTFLSITGGGTGCLSAAVGAPMPKLRVSSTEMDVPEEVDVPDARRFLMATLGVDSPEDDEDDDDDDDEYLGGIAGAFAFFLSFLTLGMDCTLTGS